MGEDGLCVNRLMFYGLFLFVFCMRICDYLSCFFMSLSILFGCIRSQCENALFVFQCNECIAHSYLRVSCCCSLFVVSSFDFFISFSPFSMFCFIRSHVRCSVILK